MTQNATHGDGRIKDWSPEQSAYEGRTDDRRADVEAGGAAAGSGAEQPAATSNDQERAREGGLGQGA
jgi:hypothetical protein